MTERGVRQTIRLAWVALLFFAIQGGYSIFETVRHLIVDGPTPHTGRHFFWAVVCLIVLWEHRRAAYELCFERPTERSGSDG